MAERSETEREEQGQVLDANRLIEGKRGITTVIAAIEHPPAAANCILLWPEHTDFALALEIAWKLRFAGTPIGSSDIIIACICINREMELVTSDKDFLKIQAIEENFRLTLV